MSSDPSNELMGTGVAIASLNTKGIVRGYDPANGKWWVVVKRLSTEQYGKGQWHDRDDLDFICEGAGIE